MGFLPPSGINPLMRSIGFLWMIPLFWVGCAVSPLGSSDPDGVQDHDWLVKLSTLRVKDETILKTQDKVALNFDDLCELLNKEIESDDLLSLVDELGVNPKLRKDELTQLEQFGATPQLLQKLGQSAPLRVARSTPKEKIEPVKKAPAPTPDPSHEEEGVFVAKRPTSESENKPQNNSNSDKTQQKRRSPSRLSSDPKHVIIHTLDPLSRR